VTPLQNNERAARLASLRIDLRAEIAATSAFLERHVPAHLDEWNEAALIELAVRLRAAQHRYARVLMTAPRGG